MINLYDELQYVTCYRENRLKFAHGVLNNKSLFPELLDICFLVRDETSIKACWILEFVCKEQLEWLLPHIDTFTSNISKIKYDSAIRPVANICELLCKAYFGRNPSPVKENLNHKHLQRITETCFDWLINDEKVAAKAYSMNALFLLGLKIDWIHPELKRILELGFGNHSAAYKARARHILRKLK